MRVEDGLNRTDTISPFYDPMIAKIITHGETREDARRDLQDVCGGTEIAPLRTNVGFLARLLNHPQFRKGDVSTSLISDNEQMLTDTSANRESLIFDAAVASVAIEINELGSNYGTVASELQSSRPGAVWRECLGFRLNRQPEYSVSLVLDGVHRRIAMSGDWMERWA